MREREIEREKNGGSEGVGEGRRGNGIVMSPASSSSDSQSREFVHRMCVGRRDALPRENKILERDKIALVANIVCPRRRRCNI